MSGLLHPVGPEPARTYWERRALVLLALALVVALVTVLFGRLTRDDGPVAVPASPAASPTASTGPPSSSGPSSSGTDSPAATPGVSGAPAPTVSSGSTPTAPAASPAPTSAAPSRVAPVACDAAKLRPTLIGDRTLKVDQNTRFTMSLINGTGVTCVATVNAATFELKVYSGTDRIWSTKDCSRAIRSIRTTLAPEKAVEWTAAWNGRRSAKNCKDGSGLPRPGVYWATAQLAGADPVQVRMTLS